MSAKQQLAELLGDESVISDVATALCANIANETMYAKERTYVRYEGMIAQKLESAGLVELKLISIGGPNGGPEPAHLVTDLGREFVRRLTEEGFYEKK